MSTDKWRAMPGGGRRLLPYKSIKGIWPHALARPLGLECWECPEGAMHYVKMWAFGRRLWGKRSQVQHEGVSSDLQYQPE